ncbi:membrane protein [Streptomyces sp. WM6373]|nr:membrane protein [Streptomyces sp. WM6373]KOU64901.1 membrane protein [Streptomyces sp. IGB124]KOU72954.1 membrane protein [Streptomyces sp. XY66]KOU88040.1 membrane protein [Streptomyces sp. XY58]KOV08408.1 membrane protein [Streptomyces sp. XY37]KOV36653.1 membrane protein [Streptomyces sp. H021]KOV51742.1 membrane protein [Streptomyces sp. MMG1064]
MTAGRIAGCLGLLVLGALTGAAGWLVVDLWFPGGLLLALLALFGLFLGGRLALGTGLGVGGGAVGWFLAYVMLSLPRPEGDFVLSSSGIGMYAYLLGGTVLAVMCATITLPADRPVSASRPVK